MALAGIVPSLGGFLGYLPSVSLGLSVVDALGLLAVASLGAVACPAVLDWFA